MMYALLLWYLLGTLTLLSMTAESSFDAKVRLKKTLLSDYIKEARPVLDVMDNVTITVGISLYVIRNMDDKNQMLTTSLWIRQVWYDPRLTWKPSNFSSVKTIHMPANKVWVPDIKIYNEVNKGQNSGLDQFQTRVVVDHDGKIKWMGPIVLRTSCQVNIKMFPFDTQTCKMKIGSWTYDGFVLDVKPESYTMDISKSPSNLEWELISTSVERNVQIYPCCPEPYPDVTYTITIKRRQQSYGINFIFPVLFLTALTLMAFVTSGERIGLVLTCLVSMFFFLKMVAERTPTSDTVPLLSIYFVMLSFEVTLIFYAVCMTLNAYHKHPVSSEMSRFVRRIVMERLGRICGMTSIKNEIKRKLESLHAIANTIKEEYSNCGERIQRSRDHDRFGPGQSSDIESAARIEENSFGINESGRENGKVRSIGSMPAHSSFCGLQNQSNDIKPSFEIEKPRSITIERQPTLSIDSINSKLSDVPEQSSCKQLNVLDRQLHYCKCETCVRKPQKNRCSSFLNEMITLNQYLIFNVQEINLLARNWDHKSSQRERWLIAASILDKTLFILFLILFLVLSLFNFFG